ncbi:hypothetical protein D9M68_617740 [compost metagenome]
MQLKTKAATQMAKCGFLNRRPKVLCKAPLKINSSQTAGTIAITKILSRKPLIESIFKMANVVARFSFSFILIQFSTPFKNSGKTIF